MHTLIPQRFTEHSILTHFGIKFQGHKQESLFIWPGAFTLLEQNTIDCVAHTQRKFISHRLEVWDQAGMAGFWWETFSGLQTVNFLLYAQGTE